MNNTDAEKLHQKLFSEIYAMAFSGMPAVILDKDKIKCADAEELIGIAKRYGIK